MPEVRATSEYLPPPDNLDAIVWRYMDLPKLVSLLANGLYMCQLKQLGDDFEGRLRPLQVALFESAVNAIVATGKAEGRDALERETRGGWRSMHDTMRKNCYVSSWQLAQHETWWMWKVYCNSDCGVVVRSTYRRLYDAIPPLSPTMRHVLIGRVTYDEHMNPDPLRIVTAKYPWFKDENELRVFCDLAGAADDSPGFFLDCRLHELADAVVVSPFSPPWFRQTVEDTCRSFGSPIVVEESMLRSVPKQP